MPGRIAVILGSARGANGNAPALAAWLESRFTKIAHGNDVTLDIVEPITHFNLPHLLTAATIPVAAGMKYDDQAVQRWSDYVKESKALILLTPVRPVGRPALTAAAIQSLVPCISQAGYRPRKPIAAVTYGGHGGSQLQAHLDGIIAPGLKAKAITPWVGVSLPKETIAGPARLTAADGPNTFAEFDGQLDAMLEAVLKEAV